MTTFKVEHLGSTPLACCFILIKTSVLVGCLLTVILVIDWSNPSQNIFTSKMGCIVDFLQELKQKKHNSCWIMLARFINNLIFLLLCLASSNRRGKTINEIIERRQTFNNLKKGFVYFEALWLLIIKLSRIWHLSNRWKA